MVTLCLLLIPLIVAVIGFTVWFTKTKDPAFPVAGGVAFLVLYLGYGIGIGLGAWLL